MKIYSRTLDLEAFYNGDFKTDKEIVVVRKPLFPTIHEGEEIYIQGCIINPHNVSVLANSEKFCDIIVDKWMAERSDKYPYILNCKVEKWLVDKKWEGKYLDHKTEISINHIDIYKHLNGNTDVYNDYYIFAHNHNKIDDIDIVDFLLSNTLMEIITTININISCE